MSHLDQIKIQNKNKDLVSINDTCVSKKHGVGHVIEVAYNDDVWYPIQVLFKQQIFEFGEWIEKRKYCHYNTNGNTNSIIEHDSKGEEIVDATFYKQINFSI